MKLKPHFLSHSSRNIFSVQKVPPCFPPINLSSGSRRLIWGSHPDVDLAEPCEILCLLQDTSPHLPSMACESRSLQHPTGNLSHSSVTPHHRPLLSLAKAWISPGGLGIPFSPGANTSCVWLWQILSLPCWRFPLAGKCDASP